MRRLDQATTLEVEQDKASEKPIVALLPVGSVEPHGPHLPLGTDTTISLGACNTAASRLEQEGVLVWLAPSVPYGVTEYARNFAGAVSVPAEVLTGYLQAVAAGLREAGANVVVLVNNHLEPAHDAAIRGVLKDFSPGEVMVACPLTKEWAKKLSAEFKHGSCHAGRYETSLVLAVEPESVRQELAKALPAVGISLAEKIKAGIVEFKAMGLERAYAGAPAEASLQEGEELLQILGEMVATEVLKGLTLQGLR
jgi:creatinine amidohydrolase